MVQPFYHSYYRKEVALPDVSRLSAGPGALLSTRFRSLGLTREYIRRMTEPGDDLRRPLTATREALFRDDAAAVAMRLFFCREMVTTGEAASALGAGLMDSALESGLVAEPEPGWMTSVFHLRLVRGLYLFSDYLGQERDAVMGAGETTAILYQAGWPDRRIRRALDLGCGAGTLALLLAGDADEVTGTDINSRAVALASFNAAVNGIPNADFRVGDLYSSVRGEAFDLILSQPPYYPRGAGNESGDEQTFLHGGDRGDELAECVVAGAPAHLSDGGRALVFTSWSEGRLAHSSEDQHVLELRTNRLEVHGTRQSLNVIRKTRDGGGWATAFEVPADCWHCVGPQRIDQLFAAEELLRGPREDLLTAKLRLPEGASVFREGTQLLLRCPPEYLIGLLPITDELGELISAVDRAASVAAAAQPLPPVVDALRRGLLVVMR